MKLSFGIVFAAVAVLGCSAVSIAAGPVSDASLRKLQASPQDLVPIGVDPSNWDPVRGCAYINIAQCEPPDVPPSPSP